MHDADIEILATQRLPLDATPARSRGVGEATRRRLVACGVGSSVVYVAAWFAGAAAWPGYRSLAMAVSELSAIDAPSRPIMIALGVVYSALVLAFGAGVLASSRGLPRVRAPGRLLLAFGLVCLAAPLAPMHLRGTPVSLTDTLHLVGTAADVILVVLVVATGARAFGRRFRAYSFATIAAMLLFGGLTAVQGPRVAMGPHPRA